MLVTKVTSGRDAEQLQGVRELRDQGPQHPLDALRAARGESPGDRPADQHGVGTERQRDRHVGAAADPAVDQDRGASADRLDDLRERLLDEGTRRLAAER